MAALTVFVDEAVQGNFPSVCARTGQPSDMLLRLEQPQGGLGVGAILLIFLGPPGWLVLVVLGVMAGRRDSLVVRIAYAERAFRDEIRYSRIKVAALTAGVASLGLALGFQGGSHGLVWLVMAGACFGLSLFCYLWVAFRQVRIALDTSRRWVTLSNLHPDFVEAACATPSRNARTRL